MERLFTVYPQWNASLKYSQSGTPLSNILRSGTPLSNIPGSGTPLSNILLSRTPLSNKPTAERLFKIDSAVNKLESSFALLLIFIIRFG